jgi:hypothetical protein
LQLPLQHWALFVQLEVFALQTLTQLSSWVSQRPLQHSMSFVQNATVVLGMQATQVGVSVPT